MALLKVKKGVSSKGKHKANSGQTVCHSRSKQFWGDNGNKPKVFEMGYEKGSGLKKE